MAVVLRLSDLGAIVTILDAEMPHETKRRPPLSVTPLQHPNNLTNCEGEGLTQVFGEKTLSCFADKRNGTSGRRVTPVSQFFRFDFKMRPRIRAKTVCGEPDDEAPDSYRKLRRHENGGRGILEWNSRTVDVEVVIGL